MRYIEKRYSESMAVHKVELILCKLDKANLHKAENRYAKLTGGNLYDMVRDMTTFSNLKQQLYEEQGGICCYCGSKLEYPLNPQYRVEHVKPKEKYRELVGEYENLLLSCRSTRNEIEIRKEMTKKESIKLLHCDEAKASKEITYSPLNPDCEKVFVYKIDGNIKGMDAAAKKDIETLGLACDYLVRRRREALQSLFDEDNELLSDDLLKEYKERVLCRDENNKLAEFCFVISNVVDYYIK